MSDPIVLVVLVVSNWAAGCGNSINAISHSAIDATLDESIVRVQQIIAALAGSFKVLS